MFFDVPQIFERTSRELGRPELVHAGQLEIDEPRIAVGSDDHVLFFVQIVVTDAARMQRCHERVEFVEEVRRQDFGFGERHAGDERA